MSTRLTLALVALVTAGVGALTFAGGPTPVPLDRVALRSADSALPVEEDPPGMDEADKVFVQFRYRNFNNPGYRYGYRYSGYRYSGYRYQGYRNYGYRYSAYRYGGYRYAGYRYGYRYAAPYYGYRYGNYRYPGW